ncbi:MAG: ABC transporter permease, partial [Candidatus Binataceae bacterium]
MQYELRIALRYLRARRKEAFISITTMFTAIGVTIGVAALIITLSVMGGFEANLRQRVLSLTPQIEIQNYAGAITKYQAIEKRADKVPGVTGSDPFLIGQAMLSSGRGISGIVVRGIQPGNAVVRVRLGRYLTHGELNSLSASHPESGGRTDSGEIALGSVLAQKLRVKVGDTVRMTAPIIAGGGLSTRTGQFRVGAIFESGVNFIDRDMVFMGLARAQVFFGRAGQVDGIEAQLANLDDTRTVTAALQKEFGSHYRVRNWIEFNRAAAAGFAMLKRVYAL